MIEGVLEIILTHIIVFITLLGFPFSWFGGWNDVQSSNCRSHSFFDSTICTGER